MKLFTIIQKNFRIFIRSKVSALIIFLGPLLLVSLIGMSFSNSQIPGLTVGTFSPGYNELTNSIISKIEDNKFSLHKYDSRDSCSDSVKRGDSAICLVFPANMDDKENNEVTFVVDYSKLNLVFIVVDIFSNKVSERATELRTDYATDLLNKVVQTKDDLNTQKQQVTTLNSKQGDAKNTLSSATESLNDINPSTDFGEDYDITAAESSLSTIVSKVTAAKGKVNDARDIVDGSSLSSSEKSSINSKLSDASISLGSALTYLEGNSSIASIEVIINSLGDALQNAKAQLDQIKKSKDSVKGDLITLQGNLDEAIKSVQSINSAIDTMSSRINDIQASDASQLISPIKTKIETVTTQETHFNYLFPTLIVLIIMITGILLSSTLVMNEKKSKSFFRNFITPTSDLIFNLGIFLTAFCAILIQLIIFLATSYFFFGTDIIVNSVTQGSVLLIIITSVFVLLGMIIGYVFKSEETYVLADITISSLLMFLSSTILPIETISNSIRSVASVTPFVVSETLLRQVMFFKFNLVTLWPELLILLGYVVVFFGVIYALQNVGKYHFSIKKKEVKK